MTSATANLSMPPETPAIDRFLVSARNEWENFHNDASGILICARLYALQDPEIRTKICQQRAEAGRGFLDRFYPEWESVLAEVIREARISAFDMGSEKDDILAILFRERRQEVIDAMGEGVLELGFQLPAGWPGREEDNAQLLTQAWQEQLRDVVLRVM